MELVLNNPFRVLGLPATATTRDIAKRLSDLETFAELGKVKAYPHDFSGLGAIDRSPEAIKDAGRKIEQAQGRLFHSFFWFRSADGVDELALESLAAGNLAEAAVLWDRQLSKSTSKKYTWRLNKGVLHLLMSSGKRLDRNEMSSALEALGFVIDDDLDESIKDVLAGNESGLNRRNLWKLVVDEVVSYIQSYSDNPYGMSAVKVIESLWSFPAEACEYASSKTLNPMLEAINDAIKLSEDLRDNDDFPSLKLKNHLDKVEEVIWEIEGVFGEDDTRFQTVANAYANEACACAIKALNDFKSPKISMMLIQWADSLPSFSQTKVRIKENLETIKGWVDSDEEDEVFGDVIKLLNIKISTLTQASSMLDEMQVSLSQIKTKVGDNDKRYITISSACAHHILGFLIDSVNQAQNTVKQTKDLAGLQVIVSGATKLTRKLLQFALDSDAKTRVSKNLETISGIDKQVAAVISEASSSNIFESIPGWVWLIGIVFLISMCTG